MLLDDDTDLGYVEDGAPCGPHMMCLDRKCLPIQFLNISSCPMGSNGKVCSGHGVSLFQAKLLSIPIIARAQCTCGLLHLNYSADLLFCQTQVLHFGQLEVCESIRGLEKFHNMIMIIIMIMIGVFVLEAAEIGNRNKHSGMLQKGYWRQSKFSF